jgi:hypothetical protein
MGNHAAEQRHGEAFQRDVIGIHLEQVHRRWRHKAAGELSCMLDGLPGGPVKAGDLNDFDVAALRKCCRCIEFSCIA